MARLGRDQVIEAAKELVDSEGVEALTTTRLTERLGLAQPSLYRHVRSRRELLDELTIQANRALLDRVQQAASARSGSDALAEVAWVWRAFAHDHPGQYALAACETEHADVGVKRELATVFRHLVESCGVAKAESVHVGRIVRSMLHGFAHLQATDHFPLEADHHRSYSALVSVLDRTVSEAAIAS